MFRIVYLQYATYICINKSVNAMVNANITRNETPPIILIELTTAEKTKLNRAITGYGKLAAAVATTCISEGTIKRAALGAKLKPDTAAKIRSLINS